MEMIVPFSATVPPIRIFAGPPQASTPHVLEFCQRIGPAIPVRLTIQPEAGCLPGDCFPNVRQKVEREGGSIRYGWAIWEWPRVFIEAEHHAVYESPDGVLVDVTPAMQEDPQMARLFLPDDSTVFDFNQPRARRDNIRQALTDDSLIHEYLKLPPEITDIMNRTSGQGAVIPGPDAERLTFIMKEMSRLKRQIAMNYTPQGAPCFCGSGVKFKRCHGTPQRTAR